MLSRMPYKNSKALLFRAFFLSHFLFFLSCKSQEIQISTLNYLECPKTEVSDSVIHHVGYSLLYNEKHEQANWVSYVNNPFKMSGTIKRKNSFRSDPLIPSKSAESADYKNSGLDRGHLAPAADMKWSTVAMKESFYMSNISPQKPSFNRGIWKKLETEVRNWTLSSDSIYVVTGPFLNDSLSTIGANNVSIPSAFFKVLLKFKDNKKQGIGFIMPNEASTLPLSSFATNIDYVEEITKLDFFYLFSDDDEMLFESEICSSCWFNNE